MIKVKLPLYLQWRHKESENVTPNSLYSSTRQVSSQPYVLTALPVGRANVTHWIGGFEDPKTSLVVVEKNLLPILEFKSWIVQPLATVVYWLYYNFMLKFYNWQECEYMCVLS